MEGIRDETLSKIKPLRDQATQSEHSATKTKEHVVWQWEQEIAKKEVVEAKITTMVYKMKKTQDKVVTEVLVQEEIQKDIFKSCIRRRLHARQS